MFTHNIGNNETGSPVASPCTPMEMMGGRAKLAIGCSASSLSQQTPTFQSSCWYRGCHYWFHHHFAFIFNRLQHGSTSVSWTSTGSIRSGVEHCSGIPKWRTEWISGVETVCGVPHGEVEAEVNSTPTVAFLYCTYVRTCMYIRMYTYMYMDVHVHTAFPSFLPRGGLMQLWLASPSILQCMQ